MNNAKDIPAFENEKEVVDLNRTFFFVDEQKNFTPSMLYHGRVNGLPKPFAIL